MTVSYSKSFIKQATKLHPKLQIKLYERVRLFKDNPLRPDLHDHGLKGRYAMYRSIDITGDYRALYLEQGDEAVFDKVGTHAQLYG